MPFGNSIRASRSSNIILHPERPFKLRPSAILTLHRAALDGISAYAGNYRPAGIEIEGSEHEPAGAHLVPEQIEELCDYINAGWNTATAIHLAAYTMWRLNWIYPFADGNGRTSRILSYMVLCIKLGYLLPGTNTIPDQITANRNPYFAALDAADAAERDKRVDVTKMDSCWKSCWPRSSIPSWKMQEDVRKVDGLILSVG